MDYMPAVISLVSVVIGYLAKAFVDSKLEDKKQKEKEKQTNRERLEELFILLNKGLVNFRGYFP